MNQTDFFELARKLTADAYPAVQIQMSPLRALCIVELIQVAIATQSLDGDIAEIGRDIGMRLQIKLRDIDPEIYEMLEDGWNKENTPAEK
jgi:hypothetical protein